ncbi:beta-N-acetylhexosaminidase [Roseobacteraceae bacterium S113]
MPAPLILAPLGPQLSAEEAAFFRETDPWGFIVFTRNLETPDQIRRLTEGLRDSVGREAVVLVDQEGGRVQRMRPPLAREWLPPLEDVARLGQHAARGIYLRHRIIAAELMAVGIDVNCAPTLDIAGPDTHPFLRNRCFGESRAQVAAMGQAAAGGLLDGGVLPVVKHWPGHGRGTVDSHAQLPRSDARLEVLMADDFAPFAALAEMPMAMSAHMVFDAIDPDLPVTHSAKAIALLRDTLEFTGLLMSDDISMDALAGDVVARSVAALEAGCDMVLHCNGDMAEMRAIAQACPPMSKDAKRRARKALAARVTPAPAVLSELMAEYDSLV